MRLVNQKGGTWKTGSRQHWGHLQTQHCFDCFTTLHTDWHNCDYLMKKRYNYRFQFSVTKMSHTLLLHLLLLVINIQEIHDWLCSETLHLGRFRRSRIILVIFHFFCRDECVCCWAGARSNCRTQKSNWSTCFQHAVITPTLRADFFTKEFASIDEESGELNNTDTTQWLDPPVHGADAFWQLWYSLYCLLANQISSTHTAVT